MRKQILAIGISAFIIGMMANNIGISATSTSSIATVDVNKVVAASKDVKALQQERAKDNKTLTDFITNAQKQLAAEPDETKRQALADKLNKELNTKRDALADASRKKLEKIDKQITGIITKQAKAKGYEMVLNKSVVIYGGADMTNEVVAAVK